MKLEGHTKFVRNLNSLGSDGKKETYSTESFKKFIEIQLQVIELPYMNLLVCQIGQDGNS